MNNETGVVRRVMFSIEAQSLANPRPRFSCILAVATHRKKPRNRGYFEQIGTYDPLPNERNEKLVSLNVDRIKYWLSVGAQPSRPVGMLLGLAGILPVHPHSIEIARRNREAQAAAIPVESQPIIETETEQDQDSKDV